ncbi:hypothetical protein D9C73_025266 [Collichthys lucidus]|uniref:Uncharacterized protein n=1 Tax=Collichthys lucidus TaxID=240159 RepID=A0A4V6AT68_COLLU|nr:hypothetical protein D9C73_025266 [Collichthys lucidus]
MCLLLLPRYAFTVKEEEERNRSCQMVNMKMFSCFDVCAEKELGKEITGLRAIGSSEFDAGGEQDELYFECNESCWSHPGDNIVRITKTISFQYPCGTFLCSDMSAAEVVERLTQSEKRSNAITLMRKYAARLLLEGHNGLSSDC